RSLAKFGHEVMYISPSGTANVNVDNIPVSELMAFSLKNKTVVDGVNIFHPIVAIHNEKQICGNYKHLVQHFLDSSLDKEVVIITYLPSHVNVIKSLKGKFFHIYECVDDHADLDYAFWGSRQDCIWEQELMDQADAITTTATSLYLQRVSIEGRNNVFMSRNAVNANDFD